MKSGVSAETWGRFLWENEGLLRIFEDVPEISS